MKVQKFNRNYFNYLFPQRTRLKTEYSLTENSENSKITEALTSMMLKDYDMIKELLPDKASNILDIGCGIGLIDLALYNHYNGDTTLHLLDKTDDITQDTIIRGFNKEYVFYNSMQATRDTLVTNGVLNSKLHTYEVDEYGLDEVKKHKYDLILSLLSCGWHYSIETYANLIQDTLSDTGILILDIRHNTGQLEVAKNLFDLIDFRINTSELKHTGGTVGDRYFFKRKI